MGWNAAFSMAVGGVRSPGVESLTLLVPFAVVNLILARAHRFWVSWAVGGQLAKRRPNGP